jgi:OOP family OmpA-OmpF porin
MKKQIVLIMCLALLVAIGFTPTVASSYKLITTTETVTWYEEKIEIKKTAENFIILADTSSSMDEIYKKTGKKKIDLERSILKSRNAEFPDLKYNAGLYTFTPAAWSLSKTALKSFYPMKAYNKAEFTKAIDQLPSEGSGITPLQWALIEIEPILSPLKGHTVVFVVTDGTYTGYAELQRPIELPRSWPGNTTSRSLSSTVPVCRITRR